MVSEKYAIGDGNDPSADDDGFCYWWDIFDNGDQIARCKSEEAALRIVGALKLLDEREGGAFVAPLSS
jgi:hypothetical protein